MFDTLGWISPFIISAIILLQEIWSLSSTWGKPVPLLIKNRWIKIQEKLTCLTSITVPRLAIIPSANNFEIHSFSDVSLIAYGAVVYLRLLSDDSSVLVRILTAKTKVVPLKAISLPKLELCTDFLSARLVKTVLDSLCLDISKINC